jgi:hypothetical protein
MAYVVDDGGWFHRWQLDDKPQVAQVGAARAWLDGLSDDPCQWPSHESVRHHPHPQDDLRAAFLLDAEAFVAYAVSEKEQAIRVLYLGRWAPEMEFHLP